jgi:transposase-like protein
MKSLTQSLQSYASKKVRNLIREAIQPGILQNIAEQEIHSILANAFNAQLISERDQILGRNPYERRPGSSARNGFKETSVPGICGPMTLRRPVTRKGTLRLPFLSAIKQAGKELGNTLAMAFWLRGASTRAVAAEINATLGTKLHHSTVSKLTNAIEPQLREWENRPLPPGIVYLFIDALYLPVRRPGFTSKQAILAALGIDEQRHCHFLGFHLGDRESEDSWSAFIRKLLTRGLVRDTLRLVISDEHKGIEAAISKCLAVPHQLCVIHKMRNVLHRVASPDKPLFLKDFKAIFWAPNRDTARQALGRLEARWGKAYPKAVELTLNRFEDFTRFFQEAPEFWTALRSTNLIERFNRELRRRLRSAGVMHSELDVTKLIWAVASAQEDRWAKRRLWAPRSAQQLQVAA